MQPFNKYYPPDWTPDKGTVNKFVGKHAYGDRARKIDQGILIVRFELPFNIWCTGCDNHIGKGVRYNAEKKQIGKYYSTPILQFRMKCHLCNNWIEIHTDPQHAEYVVVSGARKKIETWQPDKEDNVIILHGNDDNGKNMKEKLEQDPIFRLEHGLQDKSASAAKIPVLTQLQRLNDQQWKDPYTLSQQIRRKFREEKKRDLQIEEKANQLKDKHSLHIDLLPESEKDLLEAKLVDFSESRRLQIEQQKLETSTAPLFNKPSALSTSLPLSTKATKLKNQNTKNINNNNAKQTLENRAKLHTKLKTDPFLQQASFTKRKIPLDSSASNINKSTNSSLNGITLRPTKKLKSENTTTKNNLVNYDSSDSGSDE
ncbi:CWC16 protein [Cunninghamella echinulata]|nr:CWC16 protein [Cunninghamella echinulata]